MNDHAALIAEAREHTDSKDGYTYASDWDAGTCNTLIDRLAAALEAVQQTPAEEWPPPPKIEPDAFYNTATGALIFRTDRAIDQANNLAGDLAVQQAPAVDRVKLARALFVADNWGVPTGGADWDEGRVHESRIAQMYRLADGIIASGILQDAAEVEARGLEKAADPDMYVKGAPGVQVESLLARAQQVREGN